MLEKENRDLRAANEARKQKKKRSKKRIRRTEGLSIQEARDLLSSSNQAVEALDPVHPGPAPVANETDTPRQRALPKCSGCGGIGHKINRCPKR